MILRSCVAHYVSAPPKQKNQECSSKKRIRESGKAAKMYNAPRRSHVQVHRWPNYFAFPVRFEFDLLRGLGTRIGQPARVVHFSRKLAIDTRSDQPFESLFDLLVFVFATLSPVFRQMSFLHDIGEQLGIGAIGDTQHVVELLRGRPVLVRKGRHRRWRSRRLLCLGLIAVGSPQNQPARFLLAKMQHDVGGNLVGGILLAPEQRHIEEVEQRMAKLVQEHIEQRPKQSVKRRDPTRRRLLRVRC